jgi:hypothetical protein
MVETAVMAGEEVGVMLGFFKTIWIGLELGK